MYASAPLIPYHTLMQTSYTQQEIDVFVRDAIGRVATGPEYSKDLSFDEARRLMQHILDDVTDPVQAGIYLIALRMKRETEEENGGSLQAVLDSTDRVVAGVDSLVHIAEPYDGYMRGAPVTAFLPALLAACGVPAVSHGLEEVGPKFGVTQRKVLRAAGIDVDSTPQQAAERISQPDIGWSYVDQASFCKPLHDLVGLRKRMIKRPVLTTVEVLAKPICGRLSTHLITGYVHKPYPPVYEKLAKLAGFDSAAIIRGVEGGITPALNKPAKYFDYQGLDGQLQEVNVSPEDCGVEQSQRCEPVPSNCISIDQEGESVVDVAALSQASADAGLAALDGKEGAARDCLLYSAAIVLKHLGKAESLSQGAQLASQAIASGRAAQCFKNS